MWQTDNAPRREKRAPEHPSSIPLEIHIRQARERLEAERDELPALRAQVDALERQRASCTARYQRRRELDLAREIERLRTHAHTSHVSFGIRAVTVAIFSCCSGAHSGR